MSRKKKGKGKEEDGRYIPKSVSDVVTARHFFECAWCGNKLFDRHHIEEFADGGLHTPENLILLCPNCHRQVHNGEIDQNELIGRRSSHVKGDRLSGGIPITTETLTIKVGSVKFIDFGIPISFGSTKQPIVAVKLENNSLLLSTRFYDVDGNLIFWMSSNRYWASSTFRVQSGVDYLEITSTSRSNVFLKIERFEDYLQLTGRNYFRGTEVLFSRTNVKYGGVIDLNINGELALIGRPDLYGFNFQ